MAQLHEVNSHPLHQGTTQEKQLADRLRAAGWMVSADTQVFTSNGLPYILTATYNCGVTPVRTGDHS